MRVEQPDTHHSRRELDFGPGFYLTSIREQAEKYSVRFSRRKESAWLNIYDMKDDWSEWNIKTFEHYNEEWLDFVLQCRRGTSFGDYDMVIGGIADDKVFETVDMFFSGLLPKEETLRRLAFEKPNIQYCIRRDAMLRDLITFTDAILL